MKIFLKKKKNKRQEYICKRFKNLPEHEKQRLTEYRTKYQKILKNKNASQMITN